MYKVFADDRTMNDPGSTSKERITGTITKAVNSIDKMAFRIYASNACWDKLYCRKTRIDVTDTITKDKHVFHGRVLMISPTMESSGLIYKDVVCEGEMAFLQDSTQTYHKLRAVPLYAVFSELLTDHNAQADRDKQIELGEIVSSIPAGDYEWGYQKTFSTIQDMILDSLGGEIRLRYGDDGKRYLDYTDTVFDGGSRTIIAAGVNVVSMTQTTDPSAMVTDLYAYGARLNGSSEERLSLPSPIYSEELRTLAGGIIADTVIFDDITDASALLAAAQAHFESLRPVRRQYRITAADLSLIDERYDAFALGCNYHSKNALIGVDEVVRCIAMQIVIEDRTKNTLSFGDKLETLTSATVSREKAIQQKLDAQPELIRSVVNTQSEIIRGVEGGYRYDRLDSSGKPLETIYMNSPSVDTATQALRINQNGLGFWKKASGGGTPLTGNYDYAWTIDGTLNTAYLVAQTLTGLKINNGSGTFEVDENGNVTAKAINIRGGTVDIETTSESNDIIRLRHNDWTMEVSPLMVKVTNSTIGGQMIIQAGAIFGKWDDQHKFTLDSNTGSIWLYGLNGVRAFTFEPNSNTAWIYDSNGDETIRLNGQTGTIIANNFQQR